MTKTKRRFLTVTMKPELYEKVQAAAADRDVPMTAWVRELVETEFRQVKA